MTFPKLVLAKYDVFAGDLAAGGIFFAKDSSRLCLQKRSSYVREPGTWGTWGGKLEPGETPEEGLRREIHEESGYFGAMTPYPLFTFKASALHYYNFLVEIPHEFEPKLNWESEDAGWFDLDSLPSPLHSGVKILLPYLTKVVQNLKM